LGAAPTASQRPAFWALAVALLWLAWNPFGIMSKADTAGQSLLFNLTAPLTRSARPPIAVVVVDDQYLQDFRASWPLSYEGYATILDAIAVQKPRAIFFDVVFVDVRNDPSFPLLLESLTSASASSDVFLSVAPRAANTPDPIRPELAELASKNPRIHLVSIAISELARTRGQYDVRPNDGAPNAAWAIANLLRTDMPKTPDGPIELVWRGPLEETCNEPGCARMSTDPISRTLRLVASGLAPDVKIPALGVPETYRYIAAPYVRLNPKALVDRVSTDDLTGKLVFVGGSFALATDSTSNYLYKTLPNVFAHATATDNLLTLKEPLVACRPPMLGCAAKDSGQRVHAAVIVSLLWLASFAAWALASRLVGTPENATSARRLGHRIIEEGGVWLIMLMIFAFEIGVLRLAPALTFGAFAAFSLRRLDFGLGGLLARVGRNVISKRRREP
jgi:CHASE2 domain-containing sensor protein